MDADPVLQDSITVEYQGQKYEFRIPSLVDEIKLGMHERNVRRSMDPDPESTGSPAGLDLTTSMLVRSVAVFEVLLKSATVKWPYSEGKDKEPVVDHTKFPKDKVNEVAAIGLQFEASLQRFRGDRSSDEKPPGGEAVAGQ